MLENKNSWYVSLYWEKNINMFTYKLTSSRCLQVPPWIPQAFGHIPLRFWFMFAHNCCRFFSCTFILRISLSTTPRRCSCHWTSWRRLCALWRRMLSCRKSSNSTPIVCGTQTKLDWTQCVLRKYSPHRSVPPGFRRNERKIKANAVFGVAYSFSKLPQIEAKTRHVTSSHRAFSQKPSSVYMRRTSV